MDPRMPEMKGWLADPRRERLTRDELYEAFQRKFPGASVRDFKIADRGDPILPGDENRPVWPA